MDLALNKLQCLLCHQTKPNQTKTNQLYFQVTVLSTNNLHTVIWYQLFARGVVVIVVGNGHGDASSNPGRG